MGDEVLAVAREAFVLGMQAAAAISAVVAVVVAVIALTLLRNVGSGGMAEADDESAFGPDDEVEAAAAA